MTTSALNINIFNFIWNYVVFALATHFKWFLESLLNTRWLLAGDSQKKCFQKLKFLLKTFKKFLKTKIVKLIKVSNNNTVQLDLYTVLYFDILLFDLINPLIKNLQSTVHCISYSIFKKYL